MKKILIVDDEQDILEIVEKLLKNRYEVHSASVIEDPVELVQTIKPQLILMDYYIPVIGGKEAIHLLKNNKETKDIPVYFFSASPDLESLSKESGADGYITKPFKIKEFKLFVDEKLKA